MILIVYLRVSENEPSIFIDTEGRKNLKDKPRIKEVKTVNDLKYNILPEGLRGIFFIKPALLTISNKSQY